MKLREFLEQISEMRMPGDADVVCINVTISLEHRGEHVAVRGGV